MPGFGFGYSIAFCRKPISGAPSSSNATVQAWLNKVGADGYAYPGQAQVNIYTTAWDYADAQGLSSKIDVIGLLKVPNQNLCKIPFKHPLGTSTRFVLVGLNFVFTANTGILTTNADSYINTNFAETDGVHYQLNNASFGAYVVTNYTTSVNQDVMGTESDDLGMESVLIPKSSTGFLNGDIQSYNNNAGAPIVNAAGLSAISTYTNMTTVYKNGAIADTEEGAGDNQLSTYPFFILGENFSNNGTDLFAYFRNNVSFFFMASGDIDQAKLYTFATMLLL